MGTDTIKEPQKLLKFQFFFRKKTDVKVLKNVKTQGTKRVK